MASIGRVKMYHGNQGSDDDEADFSILFFDENGNLVTRDENGAEIYVEAGWHGSVTIVQILPGDFISDDPSNPEYMLGASNQITMAGATGKLVAAVPIPAGFKATAGRVYASAPKNVTVYEADINASMLTSKGTGDTSAEINITDVTSNSTNFLRVQVEAVNGAGVYGGYVLIEKA